MTGQTRQGKEGTLPLKVLTWTSIKTGKVLRVEPPLDREISPLFSGDFANVRAFGKVYKLEPASTIASNDNEFKQPAVYREFYLESPRS